MHIPDLHDRPGTRRGARGVTGIVGNRYLLSGREVEVLVQWGLKSRGESHGGPRNVRIRFVDDGSETIRPFRGLRRLPA